MVLLNNENSGTPCDINILVCDLQIINNNKKQANKQTKNQNEDKENYRGNPSAGESTYQSTLKNMMMMMTNNKDLEPFIKHESSPPTSFHLTLSV